MSTAIHLIATTPAVTRLARLAPLDSPAQRALAEAMSRALPYKARRELFTEGRPIGEAKIIVSGWAARVRQLADGRRQFISFLLPGDLIGHCRQSDPLAVSTVVALTDVLACPAPAADRLPTLAQAYAVSTAMDEAYLLAQIVRLGRMNAGERIFDLFLELHERFALAGLSNGTSFDLPLTQEVLGDALGLTSVHINRMLQIARRNGELKWQHGRVTLINPPALAHAVGHLPVRVNAAS